VRDDRLLGALHRRGDEYMYYSSSSFDRHHDHHLYHPYRRNDRGYFPNEFKEWKPPTFDANAKNMADAEAWILVIGL